MKSMDDHILQLAESRIKELLPDLRLFRHKIHSEPEVGLDTRTTAQRIREALQDSSLQFRKPLLGGDVIGDLKGKGDRTICLRADTDALPVQEETGLPYASVFPGKMHACGHDGHTTMLVGAAKVLDSLKDDLPVSVRFVFQPGEEGFCGGRKLRDLGALDGCDAAYAIHAWPGLPVGSVSTRNGVLCAAVAQFNIKVTGKGCHSARPYEGNNPIPVISQIVCRLAAMHAKVYAEDGSIISVCSIHSGANTNVIPDAAYILGTVRYLSKEMGDRIEQGIRAIVAEVCRESGTEAEIEYDLSYDLPVINSTSGYRLVREIAEKHLPAGKWIEAESPVMSSEDFAYYLDGREGAMLFLGIGESVSGLHTSRYDFNDDVLETGVLVHCLLALMQ